MPAHCLDNLFLTVEVAVDCAGAKARLIADVLHCRSVKTGAGEACSRGVQYLLSTLLKVRGHKLWHLLARFEAKRLLLLSFTQGRKASRGTTRRREPGAPAVQAQQSNDVN